MANDSTCDCPKSEGERYNWSADGDVSRHLSLGLWIDSFAQTHSPNSPLATHSEEQGEHYKPEQ